MTRQLRFIPLAAALAAIVGASSADAYRLLVDLGTLQDGVPGNLVSATIDGTTGYAVLGGAATKRIVKVEDIGGANTVSTLVSTSAWETVVGATPSSIAGILFSSGDDLLIADSVTDNVVSIDKATGVATLLVDSVTLDGNPQFSGLDASDGNLLIYDSSNDALKKLDGTINGISTVLTDTQIAGIAGDDTPTGVTADASGIIYFGQGSSGAGENITFYDPSDMSSGVLLTEEQIVGPGFDVSFSSTAFDFLPELGEIAFRDGGTLDSIRSVDPTNALATVGIVLEESELVAGPANSDFVGNFTSWQGEIAWVQFLESSGQAPGIYSVIPEPASALLAAIAGVGVLARRR